MAEQKEDPRIKKRLVALKRGGVHRVKEKEPMPTAVHIVGIGKTGADQENGFQAPSLKYVSLFISVL